ncbi:uncharacterized protein LOC126967587 [Leptidea sinapis]|uniref:uncharacterized protein LOC126967587 n=1 Tax=Leptidea sinapis TaxID=189913 RepID=UPI00213DF2DD|nr:uncharacterized protein LOC126967587 [Leptidea sinapis]
MLLVTNLVMFLFIYFVAPSQPQVEDNSTDLSETRVLSRMKRFIIFPEGSSLQLVFCLTYPAISHISDILLWGNTAALAYELPQDPYSPFNHKADPLHRRMDSKAIYYTDEDGKILYKQPYKRRPIVNPAFARRSVNSKKFNIDRGQMHASRKRPDFGDMNENHVEFHRSSRTGLYEKIETIIQGLGSNGRQCLLRTLCIIGRTSHYPQGAFLQEILRAVFTLPKGNIDDFYEEYDGAQASTEPCETLYPECPSTEPTFVSP